MEADERPILNLAARKGDVAVLQRLLALGAAVDGDGAEQNGDTPLADAVGARQADAVRVLLAAGANPAPVSYTHLRCQLQPHAYRQGDVRFDCERIRWQGDAIQADDLRLAPAALQLYSGGFLKTRPNPMMDMLVRNQVYGSLAGNPLAAYNARNVSAVTVNRVTDLVLTIELACETATGPAIAECDRLKAETVDSLMLARDEPDTLSLIHI